MNLSKELVCFLNSMCSLIRTNDIFINCDLAVYTYNLKVVNSQITCSVKKSYGFHK